VSAPALHLARRHSDHAVARVSAALGHIAGTRIGGDVDFPATLAMGITLGRATTGKALALTHSPRS
jgi:hypothetical protein